jgi:hypothetical protein
VTDHPVDGARTLEATDSLFEGSVLHPAGCPVCEQVHLVDDDLLETPCLACAEGTLEPQPAKVSPEPPELYVPFGLTPAELRPKLKSFIRPVWFKTRELHVNTLMSRLTRVWVPMWLVDALVVGKWEGEVGYNYEVKSSQEHFKAGKWTTEELIETRIRWEPRVGQICREVHNVAVRALDGHDQLETTVGIYDLRQAVPFERPVLVESSIRVADLRPQAAWMDAVSMIKSRVASYCRDAVGSDHMGEFFLQVEHQNLNWTWLLLPLYVTWYTDSSGKRRIITISGQTGKMNGARMASVKKGLVWASIILLLATTIGVVGLLSALLAIAFPPIVIVSLIILAFSFVFGCFAIWPVVRPWRWNKQENTSWLVKR